MAKIIKARDSNMEILRIVSMFLIVFMHSGATIITPPYSISNTVYLLLTGAYANYGVSFFVLISGYYGIRTTGMKLWQLWAQVLFYSLIGLFLLHLTVGAALSPAALIHTFLPISSGSYWFVTAYFLLSVSAPFLNAYLENISKRDFIKLLIALFTLFSLLPTICYLHVSGVQTGKCFANLLLLYMTGRFIRLHVPLSRPPRALLIIAGVLCGLIAFLANGLLTLSLYPEHTAEGVWQLSKFVSPFSRDCSLLIFGGAVCLFMLFRSIRFRSGIINTCASTTFGIYLFEGYVRQILKDAAGFSFDLSGPLSVYGYHFGIVLLTMFICMVFDIARQRCIQPMTDYIGQHICKWLSAAMSRIEQWVITLSSED